jgi:hypothetical protein
MSNEKSGKYKKEEFKKGTVICYDKGGKGECLQYYIVLHTKRYTYVPSGNFGYDLVCLLLEEKDLVFTSLDLDTHNNDNLIICTES